MAKMSAKAQARYDELKRISAKGGSTPMSNSTFEYVAESATEGQFAFFKGVLDNECVWQRFSRHLGMLTFFRADPYAASPKDCLYWSGLMPPSDSFIRPSLYQWM